MIRAISGGSGRTHLATRVGRYALVTAAVMAVLASGAAPNTTASYAASAPVIVNLSLTHYTKITHESAGDSVGTNPAIVHVHVGDSIVFVNGDTDAHHTATGLTGATRFSEPRWTQAVLKQFGSVGAEPWSSGDLAPGSSSAPMVASTAGTFLYGCFFHYSAGMRGEIIVEP